MFTLTIRTANAAFENFPGFELARLLREIADSIEETTDDDASVIRDINGHRVGQWNFTTEEEN